MKTTTPKKINRRDTVVDTMAKKFANTDTVEARIIANRKRRKQRPVYVYILIGVAVVTTLMSTLINTGVISPTPLNNRVAPAPPRKTVIDLLSQDLAVKNISTDQYALFLKDYLVNYNSLPDKYRSKDVYSIPSSVTIKELYEIWPKISLRTRSELLQAMPFIETKWREAGLTASRKDQ